MVNTLATDAPEPHVLMKKKIAQTCGSSPANLINGNASLKMHSSEKSDSFFLLLFKQYFISKNGLDSRLKAYNKSSPCVSRVSNTKVR